MKKALFASAAALMAFISVSAQTSDAIAVNNSKPTKEEKREIKKEKVQQKTTLKTLAGPEVSYQSKEEFYRDFGDVPNVQWTRSKYFDEARFDMDGVATTAYYDMDSKLVGSSSEKKFTDLPEYAQKKINKDYKDYTIKKVLFYDDNEANDTDMYLYGNQFDDEDNYFVELQKDNKQIVVQVTMDGLVAYFTQLR